MNRSIPGLCCAAALCAPPALACTPDPTVEYDDIVSSDVVVATVADVEFASATDRSCLTVRYEGARYLNGDGAAAFTVATCSDDAMGLGADDEEINRSMGFEPGAEVLVALSRDAEPGYAALGCWGPLHLALSEMSEAERADLLASVEERAANAD